MTSFTNNKTLQPGSKYTALQDLSFIPVWQRMEGGKEEEAKRGLETKKKERERRKGRKSGYGSEEGEDGSSKVRA